MAHVLFQDVFHGSQVYAVRPAKKSSKTICILDSGAVTSMASKEALDGYNESLGTEGMKCTLQKGEGSTFVFGNGSTCGKSTTYKVPVPLLQRSTTIACVRMADGCRNPTPILMSHPQMKNLGASLLLADGVMILYSGQANQKAVEILNLPSGHPGIDLMGETLSRERMVAAISNLAKGAGLHVSDPKANSGSKQ